MPRSHETKHHIDRDQHKEHHHRHAEDNLQATHIATKFPKKQLTVEQLLATRTTTASESQVTPTVQVERASAEVPVATPQLQAAPIVNEEFDALAAEMIKFPETYEKRRKEMDGQRFFNRFRAETNTPARRAAAEFVKTMAELIQSKRTIIEAEDPSLLVNALFGVLFVQLKKIDDTYKAAFLVTQYLTSIKNSALASIIFDVLKVDSFDKIEPAKFKADLEALKKCLGIINAAKELENQDIVAFIGDIDKCLEPARTAEPEAAPAALTV